MDAHTNGQPTDVPLPQHFPVVDRVGSPCDLSVDGEQGYLEFELTNGDGFAMQGEHARRLTSAILAALTKATPAIRAGSR